MGHMQMYGIGPPAFQRMFERSEGNAKLAGGGEKSGTRHPPAAFDPRFVKEIDLHIRYGVEIGQQPTDIFRHAPGERWVLSGHKYLQIRLLTKLSFSLNLGLQRLFRLTRRYDESEQQPGLRAKLPGESEDADSPYHEHEEAGLS